MIGIIENKKEYWIKEKDIIKNKILNLNPENKIEKLSLQFALLFIEKTIEDLEEIIQTSQNITAYQESCISLINNQNK
tara:strand:+ start:786 stop:1019 length:234 start_codon:yes stop_codon:yes gene_type:complete